MGIRPCSDAAFGGARRGVDTEKAHDDFVDDTVDGGELDWRAIGFTVPTRTSLERLGLMGRCLCPPLPKKCDGVLGQLHVKRPDATGI